MTKPTRKFVKREKLPVSRAEAFAWHERPLAFRRLLPPWENVEVVSEPESLHEGQTVRLKVAIGPKTFSLVAFHDLVQPPEIFRDVQQAGPFAYWSHEHRFQTVEGDDSACVLEDDIDFSLPLGAAGNFFGGAFADANLRRMFAWRHQITREDLALHSRFKDQPKMKIAITGSTGLVGNELIPLLVTGGHEVVRIVRSKPDPGDILWKPREKSIEADKLADVDAVVHLAGESIASGRWSEAKKKRIYDSRIEGTKFLSETLAKLNSKPKTLICASAIGYYGNRGDEILTEESSAGDDFLAGVCRDWEAAADPAREAGIRVCHSRFGVILSSKGGALKTMLPLFKWGVGGKVGSGDQYMSWVSLDDAVGSIVHALQTDDLAGPFNVTAPNPVTNKEFTKVLAKVLSRPAFLPAPAFGLRLMLGELADALLLGGQRVLPKQLEATGYQFRHTDLEDALRHLLGRTEVAKS